MLAAVDELEELHRELDVGQRPRAQLQVELRVLAGWDALALDPRLHAPDLAHVVLGKRSRYTNGSTSARNRSAERRRRRRRAGPEQRLELPGQPQSVVVRAVPVERPGERALLALRPQVGVDAEGLALGGRRADLRTSCVAMRSAASKSRGAVAVVHEQHVDVGRVRQLLAAEAAHADHRERDRRARAPAARPRAHASASVRRARVRSTSSRREPEHVARARSAGARAA